MKQIINYILVWVAVCIALYLFVSFCTWDLNPAKWDALVRLLLAMLCLGAASIVFGEYKTRNII